MATATDVRRQLRTLGDPGTAAQAQRFFKTAPGEYGAGDVFLGIRAPVIRGVVRAYRALPLSEVRSLLRSPVHENRMVALLILVEQFRAADATTRRRIARLYLDHTRWINNWDLVDATAAHIIGPYAEKAGERLLDRLASSDSLWERRIAMIATHHFTRAGRFEPTLRIATALLGDREDLIHKAVGWMLREVGKRDPGVLRAFLDRHAAVMPRTALRYAIERLDPEVRRRYMAAGPARVRAPGTAARGTAAGRTAAPDAAAPAVTPTAAPAERPPRAVPAMAHARGRRAG